MIRISTKILNTIRRKDKLRLLLLLFLISITSILEILGISSIAPLVAVIIDEKIIYENIYLSYLFNYLNFSEAKYFIYFVFILFVSFIFLSNLFIALTFTYLSYIAHKLERDMAVKLYTVYIKSSYLDIISRNSSEMIKNISTETNRVSHSVIIPILEFIAKLPIAILLLVLISLLVPLEMFVAIIIIISIYLLIYYLIKNVLKKSDDEISRSLGLEIKLLNESIDSLREIKLINNYPLFNSKFNIIASMKSNARSLALVLSRIPRHLVETIFFFTGALFLFFLYSNNIDILIIIPQLSIILLASLRLMPTSNTLYQMYSIFQYNKESFLKIEKDLLKYNELPEDKDEKFNNIFDTDNGEIKFENVSFAYNQSFNILNNLNVDLPLGKSICLYGKSGSGKSTFLDLLAGFINPDNGNILVNNHNINQSLRSWQTEISYVPQNSILINDTILKNIVFSQKNQKDDYDMKRINEIISMVELKDFIEGLPKGLETVIGERGKSISGGQKQRINLARSLYRNPKILILDEATNALDEMTELKVYDNLLNSNTKRTIIISSHSAKIAKKTDVLLFFYNQKALLYKSWDEFRKSNSN